jgi:putative ABC transport system permease protein
MGTARRPAVVTSPTAPSFRLEGLTQDLRYAARLLRRQPRHAVLTALTMALGIGATTMLFSVVYGVLMKPLPWPNSDRIVVLKESRGGSVPRFGTFTNTTYLAWNDKPETIRPLAAWSQRLVTLTEAGEPERIRVIAATASLFSVLGVRPLSGSLFEKRDETSPVVVLSERLWRQRFRADTAVIGTPLHFDGQSYTVVGVLPDRVAFPDRDTLAVIPQPVHPASGELTMFNAIALLRPGVTPDQAMAEGTPRGRLTADTSMAAMAIFGSDGPVSIAAESLREALTGDVRRPLVVLLIGVGLLLVTATANVASLQLARTTTRHRELAVRAALGAGGARLTRQLFVESLLPGVMGAAAGIALTYLLHRSMPAVLPADFPRLDTPGLDATALTFALIISLATILMLGLLPVWRVRRLSLVEVLTEDGSAPVGDSARSRVARSRMLIMSGQVTIACVLLVGASLLGRSFLALVNANRGYDVTGVLSARVSMPASMYPAAERRFAIVEDVLGRLARTPSVSAAAFTSELPLLPGGSTTAF